MIHFRSITILISLALFFVISPRAQTGIEKTSTGREVKLEYKFISTTKTSTFEKELNAIGKEGYRLVKLARAFLKTGRRGGLVAREEGKNSTAIGYEYKLLAVKKIAMFKKEFDEAVNQGFEFRGFTAHSNFFSYFEITAILERPRGETKRRFDYRIISVKGEKRKRKN